MNAGEGGNAPVHFWIILGLAVDPEGIDELKPVIQLGGTDFNNVSGEIDGLQQGRGIVRGLVPFQVENNVVHSVQLLSFTFGKAFPLA